MNIGALVLASGFSQRAGKNKLLYKLNKKTVMEYVLDTLTGCGFYRIVVVTRFNKIAQAAIQKGMIAVDNRSACAGQSISIKLGIQRMEEVDVYAFFLADQPFIRKKTIIKAIKTAKENTGCIIMTNYGNKTGPPAFFPVAFRF